MAQNKLKIGDVVKVKPDLEDPDLKVNIGGWQGRVFEINEEDNVICIRWDSLTLKEMAGEIIDRCEEEGLSWSEMYLYPTDVALTTARDSEEDVDEIIDFLEDKHGWSFLGKQGKRIQAVLDKAKERNEWAVFDAWEAHFQRALTFPFRAEVSEWQERGPLRGGDRVKVLSLQAWDDLYGILVTIRQERGNFVCPLCDLEVLDKSSANYQPVKDYAVWFANR